MITPKLTEPSDRVPPQEIKNIGRQIPAGANPHPLIHLGKP
jgi:hypothetical protein